MFSCADVQIISEVEFHCKLSQVVEHIQFLSTFAALCSQMTNEQNFAQLTK